MPCSTLQISTSVTPGAESFRRELAALSSNTSSSTLSLYVCEGHGNRRPRDTDSTCIMGCVRVRVCVSGPDTTLLAENVAAVDLTQDYAITFSCGVALNAPTWRLDFTLVPKIRRTTQVGREVGREGPLPEPHRSSRRSSSRLTHGFFSYVCRCHPVRAGLGLRVSGGAEPFMLLGVGWLVSRSRQGVCGPSRVSADSLTYGSCASCRCEPGSGPGMRIIDKYMPKLSTGKGGPRLLGSLKKASLGCPD